MPSPPAFVSYRILPQPPSHPSDVDILVAATDDEETDFQSAYSASPRGSYVESGDDAALDGEYDEQGTPTKIVGLHPHDHLDEFGAHDAQLLAPPPKPPKARERNFSTSTATNARVHRLQQRGSEDTVGGRA